MNDSAIAEVAVVNLSEEKDGVYVFADDGDGRRFAAVAEATGRSYALTTEPIFSDPHLVDELVMAIGEDLEWPESLIGHLVEGDDGRRFTALSIDTKDGRQTVGDDNDWEYADAVRVVVAEPVEPEPAYTVVGHCGADRRPCVVTVYTHSGTGAAIAIAHRHCAEEGGVADAGLEVFAVFAGVPAFVEISSA
jgi:hypothetical protein